MNLLDLSAPIRNDPPELPDVLRTEIDYADHDEGAALIETMFGVGPELLRDGEGWANETFLRFGTHNSTHVDAPWHYNSKIGGERAQTIDELPLDWFFAPGVVIDATEREDGEALSAADVEAAAAARPWPRATSCSYRPAATVLRRADYIGRGPGVSAEATRGSTSTASG